METTETWTLFPKLVALRGHLGIPQSNALQGASKGRPRRPTRPQRSLPRLQGAGRGRGAGCPRAERSGTSGRRRSGPRSLDGFRAASRARAVQSPGGALAGAADLRVALPDSCPPYWMPQPLLPALPPPSSLCAAGSCGPSGGEVKQESDEGRRRRGWRV